MTRATASRNKRRGNTIRGTPKRQDWRKHAAARRPNWEILDADDIKSQWRTWKNPDKPFDNRATVNGQQRHLAFDKEHINESQPQDYYEGGIVWTTTGRVMGSPFPPRGLGARVFVPWCLHETLGQWGFYPLQGDPTRILGEHWCMADYRKGSL